MKVLHINCNYLGTTLHQCMVEHLDRLGVESTVFVPTCSPDRFAVLPNENVVVSKCFNKWDRMLFFHKQRKIQRALQKSLSVDDFDLIHAYTLFTDGNCAYEMSKKYGVNYVVAIRNTDVNSFFRCRPHLIRRGVEIMKRAKHIFFLSESYKQFVFDKYIPSQYQKDFKAKSHVIPNGIDDFWQENCYKYQSKGITSPIKLLYAGRIDANKNIATTQKAMQILHKKGYDVSLTVVGKVDNHRVFKKIRGDSFTTYIPPADKKGLISIYRASHIFVMPSFTESFGLVYVEAISQGLPVVYSIGQGFDKQFEEGEVGFHADATSAISVADAIEKVVDGYNTITTELSHKAQRYNWDCICAQYDSIYQSMV